MVAARYSKPALPRTVWVCNVCRLFIHKEFSFRRKENLKLTLWKYYYLQQQYRRDNGKFATTTNQLDALAPGLPLVKSKDTDIKMFVNEKQFWIQGKTATSNEYISVDNEGEVRIEMLRGKM